jgi:predicted Zn-dependent peptidase
VRLLKCFITTVFLLLQTGLIALAENPGPHIRLDVEEFFLANGMQFLIVERHTTPQVACRLAIRAGSANEEAGKTGIAHMLEHMMFKGTKNFGTLDVNYDQELQDRIEAGYQEILAEKSKRNPDQAFIEARLAEMEKLRQEVQKIYVPQAFSSQLGKNGGVGINAFTTNDQTQFTVSVPSDMLEQWFSIVSEQLFEPSWREFYVEKDVVQREWAFRYINSPTGAAWLDLFATAYTAHPYRNPVIGWKSDIENFNTTDAMSFHKRYYSPDNAVCALVGDVTVEEARRLAKIYFERYPIGTGAPEVVTSEPQQQGPRKSIRFLKGARTPLLRIGFHTDRMGTEDFFAMDVLTMVLSLGRSARMTQNIVEKGLAVEAWAYNPDTRYGGMCILGGSPNEPEELKAPGLSEEEKRHGYLKGCEDLEKSLLHEVEMVKTQGVTVGELERVKKLNQREFLDRMRSNEELASTLATMEVQIGWRYLTTYLDKIAEVTPEDVQRVAKTYIQPENQTTTYVIPGGEPDRPPETYTEVRSVSGSAAAKMSRPATFENISIYPTPKGWKHPLSFERKPEKIDYPMAETVVVRDAPLFYLPDRDLPLIDLNILVKAGEVDVEDNKTGLPQVFTGTIVRGGTETYSPQELARVLDANAIQLAVAVGGEETLISLSVMREDWEKGLALLGEVITRPRFDPGVLDVVKQQALIALQREGEDAQAVSQREGMIWHFKGHPYGRDPLRGLETIPTITQEDLREFLAEYFVPSNMVVAVAGDIDKAVAVDGLDKLFSALPETNPPGRLIGEPPETPPILALINQPGQVQSQVTLFLRGFRRTNPSYWKMSLLMNVFGGNDSMMYTRLRDDLGLVYAAGFYQIYKWNAGLLYGYIGCRGDMTSQAIYETAEIMKGLQTDVPENELEQKRLDALNSFVFNVDTPSALVDVYARYKLRKEPLNTLELIQDAYMSATREELEGLARERLDPSQLQVFVVGDKTTRVTGQDGVGLTLEEDLKALAGKLGLPFKEIPLR